MIFHVTLEQAEDGWIVAECPALPGCVSQGRDEQEALENIRGDCSLVMGRRSEGHGRFGTAAKPPNDSRGAVSEMDKLGNICGKEAVKAFQKAGWKTSAKSGATL
jgi:hypothetical protein